MEEPEYAPPSARPDRWHAVIAQFGERSAGGVVTWHPDHVGVPGELVPDGAAVPLDLEAGVPLVWGAPAWDAGPAVVPPPRLGEVTSAWVEGGVLHAAGVLTAPGDAVEAAAAGPVVVASVLEAVEYVPGDDGTVDYFQFGRWRVRSVSISRGGYPWSPRWPSLALRWLVPSDPDPVPGTALTC